VALKKIMAVLAVASVLAGCATGAAHKGVQPEDLRKSRYFVAEQLIADLNFPLLQRRLFEHRAACGSAPRFIMHEGQTSYASLIDTAEIPESYENVVMADLIQYPDSWRSPERVAVRVYSYYLNDDVRRRAERMLGAIRRPGVCEPG